jgi:hypothetical protein
MEITPTVLGLSIAIAALVAGFAAYLFWAQRKFEELEKKEDKKPTNNPLALGAYERLTLFTERMKLPTLANRFSVQGLTVRDLQVAIANAIREEYDHNITQQLYVKKEIWEAVTKMKDQNTFIVNQLAAALPAEAAAIELSRKLIEFDLQNNDATLNKMILDALQFEVKSIL